MNAVPRISIEDDINFLERLSAFSALGREALRIIAIGAEIRFVPSGDILFNLGDAADGGYVIKEGSLILRASPNDPTAPVSIVGRGTLLGEFALLANTTWPVTAIAPEPSNVLRISRNLFLKMLDGFPDAAHRMRDQLMGRVTNTAEEIARIRDSLVPGKRDY